MYEILCGTFCYVTDAVSTSSCLGTVIEKPGMLTMNNAAFSNLSKLPVCGGKIISCANSRGPILVSCVKTSDITVTAKSNSELFSCTDNDEWNKDAFNAKLFCHHYITTAIQHLKYLFAIHMNLMELFCQMVNMGY